MTPEICPGCSRELPGLGRYCEHCAAYTEDMLATTDTTPEARAREPVNATEPVTVWLSWQNLASDNKRKGLDRPSWAAYKAARDAACLEATEQCRTVAFPTARVRMSIAFYVPDRRRRDPNNLTKMICDALASVVYGDDAQIGSLSWTNEGVSDKPGATVTVEAVGRMEGAA